MDRIATVLLAAILAVLVLGGTFWLGRDSGMKEASAAFSASSLAYSASLSASLAASGQLPSPMAGAPAAPPAQPAQPKQQQQQ